MTPLVLALKALISANQEMKEELCVNVEAQGAILDTVTRTFDFNTKQNKEHEFLHIVSSLLMSEMGLKLFGPTINGRLTEMQVLMEQSKQADKVLLKQKINRVQEWAIKFKDLSRVYQSYS